MLEFLVGSGISVVSMIIGAALAITAMQNKED